MILSSAVICLSPSPPGPTGAQLLADFCLRLTLGMAAALVLLPTSEVAPRFYRTQFLVILGLATAAGFCMCLVHVELRRAEGWTDCMILPGVMVGIALVTSCIGSVTYNLEGAPGGRIFIGLTILALLIATIQADLHSRWFDTLTSAALLGAAMSSMLMGHSYLVAPAMSMTPLRRLLAALFVAVALRSLLELAIAHVWWQYRQHGRNLDGELVTQASLQFDGILMLVRLGVGIIGVAFLGWLAWRCAAIRSTQSATGILYVVVILSFFGELLGLLLHTGYLLKTQV